MEMVFEKIKEYKADKNVFSVLSSVEINEDSISKISEPITFFLITKFKSRKYKDIEYIKTENIKCIFKCFEYEKIFEQIIMKNNREIINLINNCFIIFDKTGHISKTLKYYASCFFKNTNLRENTKLLMRYKLTEKLDKISEHLKNFDRDNISSILHIMNITFTETLKTYLKFNKISFINDDDLLNLVKQDNNYIYEKADGFLQEDNPDKKYIKLKSLIITIIEPFGGLTPEKWQIPITSRTKKTNEKLNFNNIVIKD